MNKATEYLKSCGTFYLATDENGQPHVRPFGAVCEFEGKLYIVTNNQKKVYQQMKANGKVEICGMHKGTWIRVEGTVKEDTRREASIPLLPIRKSSSCKEGFQQGSGYVPAVLSHSTGSIWPN